MSLVLARSLRAVVACLLVVGGVVAVRHGAGAATLDELRARAQAVADEVTGLEQRLADLDARKARLGASIEQADEDLARLELDIHDTDEALARAQSRYVDRAVEAYKSGTTGTEIEMLLSTTDLNQMVTLAHVNEESAAEDADSLSELLAAKRSAQDAQARVDARKQKLLAARADLEATTTEIASLVAERHAVLRELGNQIDELERRARIEARRAAGAAAASTVTAPDLDAAGPAPEIPKGFTSTGVGFEGTASWYGPGFEGQPTASGQIFDSSKYTAASRDLPLGTWLYVTHEGRGVVVLVNDRGPYVDDRVLDLSQAAAQAIGIGGLGWVRAEIVVKT